jgi:hypothetical protein
MLRRVLCCSKNVEFPKSNMNFPKHKKQKGVSIIVCCMNRNQNLLLSVSQWIKCRDINEIIIVDWSSATRVEETIRDILKISKIKITIIRVNNAEKWILTTAYNLAAKHTSYDKILKLDCDNFISQDFVEHHKLDAVKGRNCFYSGNWRESRNENEKHLNGVVYLYRQDFFAIGGYNEYIQSYGWDDSDLYSRLQANVVNLYINNNHVSHIEHTDLERGVVDNNTQEGNKAFRYIQTNRFLCELPEAAWSAEKEMSTFSLVKDKSFKEAHKARGHKLLVGHLVSKVILDDTLRDKAITEYERTYGHIKSGFEIPTSKPSNPVYNTLCCYVQNGLGNRIRAFASAYNLYKNLSKHHSSKHPWKFILAWVPDKEHCNCKFESLFSMKDDNITVLDHLPALTNCVKIFPNKPPEISRIKIHNYSVNHDYSVNNNYSINGPCIKIESIYSSPLDTNQVIATLDVLDAHNEGMSLLIESSSIIESKYYSWNDDATFIKGLTPSQDVSDKVASILHTLTSKNIDIKNCVGVCIRQGQQAKCDDTAAWNRNHQESWDKWRGESTCKAFIKHMKTLPDTHFFVTGDNPSVFTELEEEPDLKGKITFLHRTVWDRSTEQLVYALADVILLSKTKLVLGSNWSSFSELVKRLSPNPMLLAGVHF